MFVLTQYKINILIFTIIIMYSFIKLPIIIIVLILLLSPLI